MKGVRQRCIMINGAEVRLATLGERLVGRLIDAAILLTCEVVIMVAFFLPLSLLGWGHDWAGLGLFQGSLGQTIDVLVWVLPVVIALTWLMYETVTIASRGRTLGMRASGVEVVRAADGARLRFGASLWRALLPLWVGVNGAFLSWKLNFLTPQQFGAALWALVYVSAAFNRRRQGWHDRLAGSVVVGPPNVPLDGGN